MNLTLGILLLIASLFLVIAVVAQHGKSHGLSGAITGAAETFFGKDKGTWIDRMLGKLTVIVGLAFVAVVLVVYIIQPDYTQSNTYVGALWQQASQYFPG